eukprot:g66958.t1
MSWSPDPPPDPASVDMNEEDGTGPVTRSRRRGQDMPSPPLPTLHQESPPSTTPSLSNHHQPLPPSTIPKPLPPSTTPNLSNHHQPLPPSTIPTQRQPLPPSTMPSNSSHQQDIMPPRSTTSSSSSSSSSSFSSSVSSDELFPVRLPTTSFLSSPICTHSQVRAVCALCRLEAHRVQDGEADLAEGSIGKARTWPRANEHSRARSVNWPTSTQAGPAEQDNWPTSTQAGPADQQGQETEVERALSDEPVEQPLVWGGDADSPDTPVDGEAVSEEQNAGINVSNRNLDYLNSSPFQMAKAGHQPSPEKLQEGKDIFLESGGSVARALLQKYQIDTAQADRLTELPSTRVRRSASASPPLSSSSSSSYSTQASLKAKDFAPPVKVPGYAQQSIARAHLHQDSVSRPAASAPTSRRNSSASSPQRPDDHLRFLSSQCSAPPLSPSPTIGPSQQSAFASPLSRISASPNSSQKGSPLASPSFFLPSSDSNTSLAAPSKPNAELNIEIRRLVQTHCNGDLGTLAQAVRVLQKREAVRLGTVHPGAWLDSNQDKWFSQVPDSKKQQLWEQDQSRKNQEEEKKKGEEEAAAGAGASGAPAPASFSKSVAALRRTVKEKVDRASTSHEDKNIQVQSANTISQTIISSLSQDIHKHKYVHVTLCEGRGLASAESGGASNPFVHMYVLCDIKSEHNAYSSNTVARCTSPVWHEQVTLIYKDITDALVLDVYDRRRVSEDVFIGRCVIPLAVCFNGPSRAPEGWVTLHDRRGKPVLLNPGSLYLALRADRQDTAGLSFEEDNAGPSGLPAFDFKQTHLTHTVWAGTWNLGNKRPTEEELARWIPAGDYDIMAIGTQECKFDPQEPWDSCKNDWIGELVRLMGKEYVLVRYLSLWEIRLAVFIRVTLASLVSNVSTWKEATGIGGVMGNKGGVLIGLHIQHTSLLMINSHLAAHTDKLEARHSNYRDIVGNCKMGDRVPGESKCMDILHQYDHIIWMGDLNYRIEYGLSAKERQPAPEERQPAPEVLDLILSKLEAGVEGRRELLAGDQLRTQGALQKCFLNFNEADPTAFEPTFKVQRGVSGCVYQRTRAPSYTDRVLYRSQPGLQDEICQTSYKSVPWNHTSDHKPVYALFSVLSRVLPPGLSRKLPSLTLSISKLKAIGLRPLEQPKQGTRAVASFVATKVRGAATNAYVRVAATWLQGLSMETDVVKDSVSPSWRSLLEAPMWFNNPERLRHCWLYVQVLHRDQINSEHDIGHARLPLCWLLDAPAPASSDQQQPGRVTSGATGHPLAGKATRFLLDLEKNGLPAGVLEGTINISPGR